MCKTVQELKNEGWQIRVAHMRDMLGVRRIDDDSFMTRGQYILARARGELEFTDFMAEDYYRCILNSDYIKMPSYSVAVSPTGGFTVVEVTSPDGQKAYGKHSFNSKPFCKKTGVRAAVGRALSKIEKNSVVLV